jgi:hypothetical protein
MSLSYCILVSAKKTKAYQHVKEQLCEKVQGIDREKGVVRRTFDGSTFPKVTQLAGVGDDQATTLIEVEEVDSNGKLKATKAVGLLSNIQKAKKSFKASLFSKRGISSTYFHL